MISKKPTKLRQPFHYSPKGHKPTKLERSRWQQYDRNDTVSDTQYKDWSPSMRIGWDY
jgi:hypothetical protein